MAVVFLGLGSNLGERDKNIMAALLKLKENDLRLGKVSTFIETEPCDVPPNSAPQGSYLNAVAKFETSLSPQELLLICLAIESELGRVRTYRNAPRMIDIDILFYDNITMDTPELKIPHPRMLDREFVMKPLLEIAPEMGSLLGGKLEAKGQN